MAATSRVEVVKNFAFNMLLRSVSLDHEGGRGHPSGGLGGYMIRIVEAASQQRHAASLRQHFELRHAIFVRERGWTDFDRGDIETDQYDNHHAVYALCIGADQQVIGCFRLYPTVLPHMISESFAWTVEGAVIQEPDVLELTRFGIKKGHRGGPVYLELFLGLTEYCLHNGISGTTALIRAVRKPVMEDYGLSVRALGPLLPIDGEMHLAVHFAMDETVLERLRQRAGVSGSVLEN